MGIIYKLTAPNGKIYIGQTIRTLAERFAQHVYEARHTPDNGCVYLNHSLNYHGPESFTREILIQCDNNELNTNEKEMIEHYNSLTPNGLNILSGGNTNKIYSNELKEKMSRSLRKNDEDKQLRMYVNRINRNGKTTFRIKAHPLCANKTFTNYDDACIFLDKLESGEIEPIPKGPPKKKKELPKYIMKHKNGYTVEYNGQYMKGFVNKQLTDQEKLNLAIKYVETLTENKV